MFNSRIKVLVVDDFSATRVILRNLLHQLGFENVDEAVSGAQAINKLREGDYGFVISEWTMPDMHGIELLRNIRGEPEPLKNIPFLMVDSESRKDKVIEAIRAGADDYIVKPFTTAALREKIENIAHKKKSLMADG